jgi:hypothetical protein
MNKLQGSIFAVATSSFLLVLSTIAFAQTVGVSGRPMTTIDKGTGEFQLSGAGTSDKDFDSNVFNLNLAIGRYMSNSSLGGIRQSASANNHQVEDETDWNGSTRLFYDYHFMMGSWRPLVGVSIGYIYGETIEESWIAGPELGLKYYVNENAFVSALIEYQFLFDDADEAGDQFEDGVYIYSAGIGINF